MFFYPDPEPIGHCITEVSPSYLTDGVFFSGRSVGPTHKCVAKQLSAIPRGPSDPVAPRTQVSPRTLERWTVESKAWYVDNCGRNGKALHGMMGLLPKEKVDLYAGWKSKVALFPRSDQYEYWYIRDMRMKNSIKHNVAVEADVPKFTKVETDPSWRDKVQKRVHLAVGDPDDYAFQALDSPDDPENILIRNKRSEKKSGDSYNVPGSAIYRQENQEENDDVIQPENHLQDRTSGVKLAIPGEGENPKDDRDCDCSGQTQHKSLTSFKTGDDDRSLVGKIAEVDPVVEHDPRWHVWNGVCDVPRDDLDRKNAMLNLSRPYRHELNTWYSRNKPTKLIPLATFEGKRPILQWHFSNL